MRISDWSSDVCSSDLSGSSSPAMAPTSAERSSGFICMNEGTEVAAPVTDRKSVVKGKSVSVRVDLGGRRIIKKKKDEDTALNRTKHDTTQTTTSRILVAT